MKYLTYLSENVNHGFVVEISQGFDLNKLNELDSLNRIINEVLFKFNDEAKNRLVNLVSQSSVLYIHKYAWVKLSLMNMNYLQYLNVTFFPHTVNRFKRYVMSMFVHCSGYVIITSTGCSHGAGKSLFFFISVLPEFLFLVI